MSDGTAPARKIVCPTETIQPFICSSKKDGVEVRLARTFARFTAQNIWDESSTLTLRLGGKNDMKRRTFLRNAAAGGLAVAVAPSVTRSADQKSAAPDAGLRAISTDRAPKPVGPFSQAIKANGFVFVAGITARDPKSGQVIEDDITKQTELVMENIKAILEAAGSSFDRTVKTTVYLKDMNDFDAMGKVYSSYFPAHPPARATVEVVRLHGGRVEIELIALA
jgi:2-iminobutanoate/2-iminopropanoate deaminase